MSRRLSSSDDDAVVIDRDDISNYNPEHILPQSPAEIKKIREWLQATDYAHEGGEFRRHLASYMEGTTTWLTSSETFRKWSDGSEDGALWIKGIPGSGKSVIAAHIVQLLALRNPGAPVLYFFFRQIIDANHEPAALLRDWLDQVLEFSPPLQKELKELVEARRSLTSLSMDDLWKYLRLALSNLPAKAVCVADALDEMDGGNDDFLRALATFGNWKPHKVKLLITSRPVPSVETPLRNANMLRMRLDEDMVDLDIASYVERALISTAFSSLEKDDIRNAVPGRANGIFLYARLAMNSFLEPGAQVDEVLKALPLDLNHMYTSLLREHGGRSGVPNDIQRLILQWVTHASRPLRLLEVAEMISTTYQSSDPSHSKPDLASAKALVRAAAGPLLTILPDETVCVIHHSFTEYLKGTTRTHDDGGYPILDLGATHAQLALACLDYLQAGCLDTIAAADSAGDAESDTETEDVYERLERRRYYRDEGQLDEQDQRLRLQFPFFAYTIPNWYVHVGKSYTAGHDQTELVRSIVRFLDDPKRRNAWISGVDEELKRMNSLHIAARFGLTAFARELISTGVDVNKGDYYGKTAVWWAANRGHADIVRLLVGGGANPNEPDKIEGLTPLHEAAKENHAEAVQVLLDAGVDPLTPKTLETPGRRCGNAPTTKGHTPLMYTCHNGHLEALDAFLPFLKDIDMVHRAFSWSASRGRVKLVERILQHPGVDINAKYRDNTPLYLACVGAHRETILALLDNGADPNIFCGTHGEEFGGINSGVYWYPGRKKDETRGLTALHALCSSGRRGYGTTDNEPEMLQELFPLFLSRGARLDVRTESGSTLLHAAVNSPVLVRMLLRAGADANALDDSGRAPLHSATSPDSISVLIEEGHAKINAIDPRDGRTPLLGMLATYHKEPIMKLLEYNPDMKAKDKKGDGPLHTTLTQWNTDPEIITALLSAGADPNERNRAGETPLLKMKMDNRESGTIVDLLLKAGSDINLRDHAGLSILTRTVRSRVPSSSGHEAIIHKDITDLIEKGAKLDVRDYKGRTLLHHAIATQEGNNGHTNWSAARPNRFDFLITLGLDLRAVDYHGNSLLHELALRSNMLDSYSGPHMLPLWNQLISLGLDPNQQNNRGRTVLHQLAAKEAGSHGGFRCDHVSVLDLALSQVWNIDQSDHQGLTALHLASTVCEYTTKKLLDAGADPSLPSNDGLTPLHLAARVRQCNSVGLLLEFLARGKSSIVDAKDEKGRSALYYACQSGRPETVKLLIDAGANTSDKTLFAACAAFEDEQGLWEMPRHAADTETNESATGLTIDDPSRPTSHNNSDWRSYGFCDAKHSLRLEDIIELLVAHGCNTASLTGNNDDDSSWFNPTLLQSAARIDRSYTFGCFTRALQKIGTASKYTNARTLFQQNISESLRAAEIAAATDAKVLHAIDKPDRSMFVDFLKQRQFHVIRPWYNAGVNFLSVDKDTNKPMLGLFVEYGYANLLGEFGKLETTQQLEHGKWHAFEDENKPGLYFDVNLNEHTGYSDPLPYILLFAALERAIPNMDILRLLVDEFHVDVNQPRYDRSYEDGQNTVKAVENALHRLAKGTHWWHVHLALPYLISKGAEINAKDNKGCTPLHIALGGPDRYIGPFNIDAARFLVASGADVNARDNDGRSCLASTAGNLDMMRLLIDHGVVIDAAALFMAINSSRVDVLKLLLVSGGDPNKRRDPLPPRPDGNTRKKKRTSPFGDDMPQHEIYPLYAAATRHGAGRYPVRPAEEQRQYAATAIQLVEALLEAGASPYAAFTQKSTAKHDPIDERVHREHDLIAAEKKRDSEQRDEEVTLLHELVLEGELVYPILNLRDLNPNHRDAQGLTLLHAAAHKQCLGAPIDSLFESGAGFQSSLPSYLDCLLTKGADVMALDNEQRNVLHHIFLPRVRWLGNERDIQTFVRLTRDYNGLLSQADVNGTTPLHMALKYAVYQHDTTPAETLIAAGANVHATEANGNTCLHILAFRIYNSVSIRALFSKLVARGLDINAENIHGETPVFNLNKTISATRSPPDGSPAPLTALDALSFFENIGADLFAINNAGQGLLHIAAKETIEPPKNPRYAYAFAHSEKGAESEKSITRFEALLKKGLDPMMEDSMKRTCLDVAAACGKESVLKLFEGDGDGRAPRVVVNEKGKTEGKRDGEENEGEDDSEDDLDW